MTQNYRHLGWLVSPYSAKTRSYLRHKGIPFEDVAPSVWTLFGKVRRTVGRPIMPTVITPDGALWQDTSEIIDTFEARFPEPSAIPESPAQRVASYLLELHGDEWLIVPALYYRWSEDTSARFAVEEFGRNGLPYAPRFMQRRFGRFLAARMQRYLPVLGALDELRPGIERFTRTFIANLDEHLARCPFLLGMRPSIGDFALFGPLWAHLYRDPGSRWLFDDASHVKVWFDRLLNPSGAAGEFLPNDEVPETLDPIFQTLFAEQFPFVEAVVEAVNTYCAAYRPEDRVPRALGTHEFTMGGVRGERKLVTFIQWMAQRPVQAYWEFGPEARRGIDAWLERVGGEALPRLEIEHRLKRERYREVLA